MRGVRESLRRWKIEPERVRGNGLVFLREADPQRWIACFGGALLNGRSVALAAPDAPAADLARMESLLYGAQFDEPAILVRTGGTTGRIRWARHTWDTLTAAADGFLGFFGEAAASAVNVLPLYHVGGLMSVVRAMRGGGVVRPADYRTIGSSTGIPAGFTVSLVPTQLHRLLEDPAAVHALRPAGRILLGGARADSKLLAAARRAGLPVAPCYGMTETGALVLALTPERFLAGDPGVGRALPHVELVWQAAPVRPELPAGVRRLGIRSPSLCHGYWPASENEGFSRDPWWTPDLAVPSPGGDVEIVGRIDRVIISGGENVDAERVEAVLRSFPGVTAVAVIGLPDADWGERVVAVAETGDAFDSARWHAFLRKNLAPAERPKALAEVEALPRTAMGKPDLQAMRRLFR